MFKKDPNSIDKYAFMRCNREVVIKLLLSGMAFGVGIGVPIGLVIARIFV